MTSSVPPTREAGGPMLVDFYCGAGGCTRGYQLIPWEADE